MIGKTSNNQDREEKLTTGVDIVNVSRINKILLKNRDQFYNKIFTPNEIKYIEEKGHKATTVSGLFAAKEAVSKAIGTGIGILAWKDMEILHTSKGKPFINFTQKGKELVESLGILEIQISISHEVEYAIAFAVGYKS